MLKNNDGDTPLHLAVKERNSTIIKFIFSSIDLSEGLSKAICSQTLDKKNIFHCAIDCGNFLVYDANGRKVSTFAIMMIDLLINSEVQEEDIVRCLCQMNYGELTPIQYLMIGSKINEPNSESITEFLSHLLFSKLNPESKQRIFSVTTSDGNTLIHLAVEWGLFDSVQCLVNQKFCTFAICNEKDESPLHIACLKQNKLEVSLWLCEHGYDPYQLDKSGNSPLFNAIKSHHPLPEKLFKTMHWKPTSPALQVEVNSDSARYVDYYRHVNHDGLQICHTHSTSSALLYAASS